jgi:hypothetical protein
MLTADLFKATAADRLTSAQRKAVEAVGELNQPSGKTLLEKINQKVQQNWTPVEVGTT